MNLIGLPLSGAYLIELDLIADERGYFARTWCAEEFQRLGLNPRLAQCSISSNTRRGTLRGMHYQAEPFAEAKLVRCSAGAIHDVIVDLRQDSPTYCKWIGAELTSANHKMLYVPEGFAHGFQTLVGNTEVTYHISAPYQPDYARGVRWNDAAFGIEWPIAQPILSARDRAFADHRP
ncbi:MAG TPA: dTDP-4-dehydrorhamnose 3,5-epimerase [Candidatus Acidoferrales bacterium]|nr:dTDP-4-dehydrorhamnose 3,5-epimerase [Candidatus Acidoferrales bacterium]